MAAVMELAVDVSYQGCADGGICYPPVTRTLTVTLPLASDVSASPLPGRISVKRVAAESTLKVALSAVPVARRAWHAGASSWRGRSRCNDFSVGIELEGTECAPFEEPQYVALVALLRSLSLRDVAAHSDIAPGRKRDPGAHFDWPRLLAALASY